MAKHREPAKIPADYSNPDVPLRFPGCPCDVCLKPVTTMRGNLATVLEPEEGKPYWTATHGRCARRRRETARRKAR